MIVLACAYFPMRFCSLLCCMLKWCTFDSAAPTVAPPSADPAWKYCTMPDKNMKAHLKCNFCSYVGTGGITRMKHHLSCLKKEGAVCCNNVPADVKEEIRKLLSKKDEAKQKRTRATAENLEDVTLGNSDGSCDEGDILSNPVILLSGLEGSSSSRKVPVYGSMDKFCTKTPEEILAARNAKGYSSNVQSKVTTQEREAKRVIACEYICKFFYDATIAHNAATLPSFHLMVEAIGAFGRGLRAPTPYEIGGPFLQKAKKKVEDGFVGHKEAWEINGCSVMTDAWSDKRGRGVMNLVVHSGYGVVFLDSVDCSQVKKDGKYIFELIDRCIEDIGEKNVVQVVTDNAAANLSAAAMLRAKRPKIFWSGCAAHTIDLMLEDVGKLPIVERTILKGRSLTVFLYSHTRVLALMRNVLGKDLVRSGVTRFATAYLNLRSLLDNKSALQKLFRSEELNEWGYLKKAKGKCAAKIVRADAFWKGVETAVNFFEPMANVLRRMDSDVPAMGFIHGCMIEAKKDIATRFENDMGRIQEVNDIIDKRWDNKLKTPLHLSGYYLNPYYYYDNKVEIEMDGTFRDGLINCITKMYDDPDLQDAMITDIDIYMEGQGSFAREIAVRQRKNKYFDPGE